MRAGRDPGSRGVADYARAVARTSVSRDFVAPAVIVSAATVLRGTGALLGTVTDRFPDSSSYWGTGDSLDGGPGFGSRPPVYPLFLQLCRGISRLTPAGPIRVAGVLQLTATVVAMWLAWSIIDRVVRIRPLALVCLIVVCAYAPMWDFDRTILSEALATPLAILVMWGLVRDRFTTAAVAAALLGLTKTSAAGLCVAVAALAVVAWRRGSDRRTIVRAGAVPLLFAIGGQLAWFAYGAVVIDEFTPAPANSEYGSYANARYCGYSIEGEIPGAEAAAARVDESLPVPADRTNAARDRSFGTRTAAEFKAVSAIAGQEEVGRASRSVQLRDPLRLVGCSVAKAGRAVVEIAAVYPAFDPTFHDDPAWFREPTARVRSAAVELAPILSLVGLVGLVLAAASGVAFAGRLLTVVGAQLVWIGVLGNGQLELFRLRCTVDVALIVGVFAIACVRWDGLRTRLDEVTVRLAAR